MLPTREYAALVDELEPMAAPRSGQPHFDLVLIFPLDTDSGDIMMQRDAIVARARSVGIEVVACISRDQDEKLLLISAPDGLLEKIAEHLTMEKRLKKDKKDGRLQGYTDFKVGEKERFEPDSSTSFFSSLERIRLLQSLIELPQSEGGCGLNLEDLLETKVLTEIVPVHEIEGRLEELERIWVKAPFTLTVAQPLDKIRDYYGERIAIYYAFLEELTNALVYPAVVGVLLFIVSLVWFEGSNDNPFTPFYSFQILVWITYFCKMWRRTEAVHAVRWNVSDFRETERPRHEFDGDMERGFYSDEGYWVAVDGNEKHAEKVPLMKKFLHTERRSREITSYLLVMPFLLAVIVATGGILAYKSSVMVSFYVLFASDDSELTVPSYGVTLGSVVGGALNGLFISVTNMLYARLAEHLTEWENHRTQSDFDDALIVKTMFFQFINSYMALYYIAFVKANEIDLLSWATGIPEYCHDKRHFDAGEEQIEAQHGGLNPYCMNELSLYMTSVVISASVVGKVLEFITPWMSARLRQADEEYAMYTKRVEQESGDEIAKRVQTTCGRLLFIGRFFLGTVQQASAHTDGTGAQMTEYELPKMTYYEGQAKLEPFEGIFSEYSNILLQLGYVVLFAPAFPLASALLWLSFYFELRTDAYKMVCNTRRPAYLGAEDIGAWQTVLRMLAALGVLTNLGLAGITDTTLKRILPFHFLGLIEINESNKVLFLVVLEHLLLLTQYCVLTIIPDVPEDIAIESAKQQKFAKFAKLPREDPPPPKEEWDDDALINKHGGVTQKMTVVVPSEAVPPTDELFDVTLLDSWKRMSTSELLVAAFPADGPRGSPSERTFCSVDRSPFAGSPPGVLTGTSTSSRRSSSDYDASPELSPEPSAARTTDGAARPAALKPPSHPALAGLSLQLSIPPPTPQRPEPDDLDPSLLDA